MSARATGYDTTSVRSRDDARAELARFLGRHTLSEAHRRVADLVVEQAPDCLFLSAAGMAERAGVSQASVTRLAQAVGFSGYAAFQDHLRTLLVPQAPPPAATPTPYQLAVRDEIRNLEALEAGLGEAGDVQELGRRLARSIPLVVLSVRLAAPVATYFSYFAARIHPDVRALSGGASTTLDGLSQARQAGAEWMACFLLPPYPQEVLTALSYAREIGLAVATVTDRPSDTVNRLSEVVIPVGVGSRLRFESVATPMVYANILLEAMAEAAPRRTKLRLAEYDRMVATHRLFYRDR